MQSFSNIQGRPIMLALVQAIQENAAYLSEIDGAIGDGDHGINMNKGFTSFASKMGDHEVMLAEGLEMLGMTLITDIGGAMGPLYGTLFTEMADVCADKETIDREVFGTMLKTALDALRDLGGATVGDKTLMDTLIPAQAAYAETVAADESFANALQKMAVAAEQGKESTRDLVAKIGRASRLGERSKGHLDAGATSCNLILQAMVAVILELLA